MSLINNIEELDANVQALEDIRRIADHPDAESYRSLVEQGMVFMPKVTEDGLSFAPSRFIGYVKNSFMDHAARDKNGSETTTVINRLLRNSHGKSIPKAPDQNLEHHFLNFASRIGVTPENRKRSYWITPEVSDWLEQNPILGPTDLDADRMIEALKADESIPPTTRFAMIKARIGQGLYRSKVLQLYRKCLITGVEQSNLLRASHIKAWKYCYLNPKECLSPDNALLLTPTWDHLFDRGFISFSDSGDMLISKKLEKSAAAALGIPGKMKVSLSKGQRTFMKFHRQVSGFETKSEAAK